MLQKLNEPRKQPTMSPELYAAVITVVKEKAIPTWLVTANPALGNRTPSEVLASDQEQLIWDAIKRTRSGDPA